MTRTWPFAPCANAQEARAHAATDAASFESYAGSSEPLVFAKSPSVMLALLATHTNREDLASAYTDALIGALESPEFERLPWRGLDNATFEATWVIERVRKSIARDLPSGSQAA